MILHSSQSSLLFLVVAIFTFCFVNISQLVAADDDSAFGGSSEKIETQVAQAEVEATEETSEEHYPRKIPVDLTKLNDTTKSQPRIPSCKRFYVYQEGCPFAYQLYDQGGVYDSQMGTYDGIYQFQKYDDEGYGIFPIYVAQYGTPNQLYFVRNNVKYWLRFLSTSVLSATPRVSKASWFHLTPTYPMQISVKRYGVRNYYTFYSDTSACTDSYLIGHNSGAYTGRKVYVYGCV